MKILHAHTYSYYSKQKKIQSDFYREMEFWRIKAINKTQWGRRYRFNHIQIGSMFIYICIHMCVYVYVCICGEGIGVEDHLDFYKNLGERQWRPWIRQRSSIRENVSRISMNVNKAANDYLSPVPFTSIKNSRAPARPFARLLIQTSGFTGEESDLQERRVIWERS